MILTVTPNANLDKTFRVEAFTLDRVHRPSLAFSGAGGKGINVARVYQTLGGTAVATGFLGGMQGRIIAKSLDTEGIAEHFVRVRGESRTCIAVVDPVRGTQTEINEPGPPVGPRQVRALSRRVAELLSQQRFAFVVLSGSLPPGTPDDFYAGLTALAKQAGVPVVLDSSGAPLRAGLGAIPWMVKPNRVELEAALGRPVQSLDEALAAGIELHHRGIAVVAVTLGEEGALLITGEDILQATPPKIQFASAVASGDSFLAAFLWEWQYGRCPGDAESALRLATGAGAANAAVIGAGFCTHESILAHAADTIVKPVKAPAV